MLNLKEKALFSGALFPASKPVDLSGPHGFESHSRRHLKLTRYSYFLAFFAK